MNPRFCACCREWFSVDVCPKCDAILYKQKHYVKAEELGIKLKPIPAWRAKKSIANIVGQAFTILILCVAFITFWIHPFRTLFVGFLPLTISYIMWQVDFGSPDDKSEFAFNKSLKRSHKKVDKNKLDSKDVFAIVCLIIFLTSIVSFLLFLILYFMGMLPKEVDADVVFDVGGIFGLVGIPPLIILKIMTKSGGCSTASKTTYTPYTPPTSQKLIQNSKPNADSSISNKDIITTRTPMISLAKKQEFYPLVCSQCGGGVVVDEQRGFLVCRSCGTEFLFKDK